ncbi:MAG: Veg family protein [Clostridia bacterium]|nr:Veg family protein [Clostridia bacterium]
MYIQKDLVKIKTDLADNVGHKVRLKAKRGRKQIIEREGVIESTYPSIFTVKLDIQNDIPTSERRVSYSYADVLTKTVELYICDPEEGSAE